VHYQTYLKTPTICTDCTTPLFYVLAPTCFGSSLPSSGSLLDPPELLEIQIGWVVYHIMCGYVTCVPGCCGSVTPLFYILAPTCFGSSLPLSGSFLDPSELLEIQIGQVVYHITCDYVTCVPDCCGSITPLFYILASTCFGSSLPSSGSLLDSPDLLDIQIGWVVVPCVVFLN
jgi:hypothetical protein